MSPFAVALFATGAAVVAAAGVRAAATSPDTRRVAPGAAVAAGAATVALAAVGAPVPAGTALVAAGMAAAAAVDAVERRVPTGVARLTGAAATGTLVARAAGGDPGGAATAALLTLALVAGFAALWLARALGFGDVRLAAGTAPAMLGGVPALVLLAWGALLGGGLVALARRARARRRGGDGTAGAVGSVPFAPPLAVAWLVTMLAVA